MKKDVGVRSLRLPTSVMDAADARARELGLTFTEWVEVCMRKAMGMKTDPRTDLLIEIANRLRTKYPTKTGFPLDVTLEVFREIRRDPALSGLYDAAIRDEAGNVSEGKRWTIHKMTGQHVRRVLDAKVVGRSVPLDPAIELIATHALLAPGA